MTDRRVEELASFALEFTGPNACKVKRTKEKRRSSTGNAPVDK